MGAAYLQSPQSEYKDDYLRTKQYNVLLASFWRDLKELSAQASLTITPLKGLSLLNDIYLDWGERPLSDIDILVSATEFEKFENLLISMGATHINEKKWKANDFKKSYQVSTALAPITIEIHKKLLFTEPTGFKWELNSQSELELHHQIVYLMGHLAHQHNFLKLFWLVDIYKLLSLNKNNISWKKIFHLAKKLSLVNSVKSSLYAISIIYKKDFFKSKPNILIRLCLSYSFLLNPRKHFIRYFLLKHLIKDQLSDALLYDLYWTVNKLKK